MGHPVWHILHADYLILGVVGEGIEEQKVRYV
jgi:hypothetical protein